MDTSLLETYCGKYGWNDLKERLKALEAAPELRIGFLGEFSSGKSTLVNALLGAPLLPTGAAVTTKRVTEIQFRADAETPRFFDGETEISREAFAGEAKAGSGQTARVRHPPVGWLKEGFSLIDTPGLSSLDEMDADLTFGFLPFLDGAVICVDSATGSLGRSVVDFLNRPEVRPLIGSFVFALTKADNMTPEEAGKVRAHVIDLLQKRVYADRPDTVPQRVALTEVADDGAPALAADSAFVRACGDVFMARARIMREKRQEKERENIRREMLARFEALKEMLPKSLPDMEAKRKELEAQKEELRREQTRQEAALDALSKGVEEDIARLVADCRARLEAAEPEEFVALAQAFPGELNRILNRRLKEHFTQMQGVEGELGPMAREIEAALEELAEPGLIEGFSDGLMLTFLEELGPVGEMIQGFLGGYVTPILGINLLAGFLKSFGSERRRGQLDAFIAQLPARLGSRVRCAVAEIYERDVFGPLEERTDGLRRSLEELWRERDRNLEKMENQLHTLEKERNDVRMA